jgi:hypothetical protein
MPHVNSRTTTTVEDLALGARANRRRPRVEVNEF